MESPPVVELSETLLDLHSEFGWQHLDLRRLYVVHDPVYPAPLRVHQPVVLASV